MGVDSHCENSGFRLVRAGRKIEPFRPTRCLWYHAGMTSSLDTKNLGGRPATGQGTPVMVRMHDPILRALDTFAADQPDPVPSRPEAVRRALAAHLRAKGYLPATSDQA